METLDKINDDISSIDNNETYWLLDVVLFVDFKLREYKPLKRSMYIGEPKR